MRDKEVVMFLFSLLIKMSIALLTILHNDTVPSFLTDPLWTPARSVIPIRGTIKKRCTCCTKSCALYSIRFFYYTHIGRDSVVLTRLRAGQSWFRIPTGQQIFPNCQGRFCGPPILLFNEYRVCFHGVSRSECEVDYPCLFNAEVKNGWTSTSVLLLYALIRRQEQLYLDLL
jgi:hypothetical protein